uniref:protein boule-like n=1 Tax=Styela clava TaxID=7725 RepID=UPI00193A91DE|nr:protein boule-like [Styela clava]
MEDPIPRRVFVGNFDFQTTEAELLSTFEACGRIVNVNIVRKSLTDYYGFVTFMDSITAEDVLSGKYSFFIRGRKLRIRKAYLRSKNFDEIALSASFQRAPMTILDMNKILASFERQCVIEKQMNMSGINVFNGGKAHYTPTSVIASLTGSHMQL